MSNIKELIEKWYKVLNFPQEYDAQFNDALSSSDIDEALLKKDIAGIKEINDNLITFFYALAKCEVLEGKYMEKGIPYEIFFDTISDIKVWVIDYYGRTKTLGLDQPAWISLHLDFKLFKLGRLQYEFKESVVECSEAGLNKGDNVLGIHIPRNGTLTRETCKESIQKAEVFYREYFPEYYYNFYTCASWLLSSELEAFLEEDSNILKFKNLFKITKQEESDRMLSFVFSWDTTREDALKIDAKTSLQKKVQKYLATGKPLHWGYGFIRR